MGIYIGIHASSPGRGIGQGNLGINKKRGTRKGRKF
jgi:hypothetical protein